MIISFIYFSDLLSNLSLPFLGAMRKFSGNIEDHVLQYDMVDSLGTTLYYDDVDGVRMLT
jgi:hypothetical protein